MSIAMILPAFLAFLFALSLPFFGRRERVFVLIALIILFLLLRVGQGYGEIAKAIEAFGGANRAGGQGLLTLLLAVLAVVLTPEELTGGPGGGVSPTLLFSVLGVLAVLCVTVFALHRRASRRQSDD